MIVNYYPIQTPPVPLTDLNVGSVTRTMLETIAREMAMVYLDLDFVYKSAFIDSAEGGSLDRVVALVGVSASRPATRLHASGSPPPRHRRPDHRPDRHAGHDARRRPLPDF